MRSRQTSPIWQSLPAVPAVLRIARDTIARFFAASSILVVAALTGCGEPPPSGPPQPPAVTDSDSERTAGEAGTPTGIRFLTGAGNGNYARAMRPRAFRFPEDHGEHPEYRSEWWYFTGNVATADKRHFGFEFTVFRYALASTAPANASAWSTHQFWMAHLAVTDTQRGELIAEERLTRGALGLAGAESNPLHIWVEDWSVLGNAGGRADRFSISARGRRAGLELTLEALKPPVLHGDKGLDPKGPEPGNASYYYSLPRMAVAGVVTVDGTAEAVEGEAWMDREWSTSALSPNVEGWDWFALQLSDGRELMIYRLRRTDGSASPFSSGSLIGVDGNGRSLGVDDFELEVLRYFNSETTGIRYPTHWKVTLPGEELKLEVHPYVENQEINLTVRYWEGAVRVEGTSGGDAVAGNGYVELAGYSKSTDQE